MISGRKHMLGMGLVYKHSKGIRKKKIAQHLAAYYQWLCTLFQGEANSLQAHNDNKWLSKHREVPHLDACNQSVLQKKAIEKGDCLSSLVC